MRQIPDWPEYSICADGFVWRCDGEKPRQLSVVLNAGRPFVTLHARGKKLQKFVSILVCLTYHGPKPHPDMHAAHENGVCSDNRPENVSWKTRDENEADKIRHRTLRTGSRVPGAKIHESDIPTIMRYMGVLSAKKVAKIYHVTPTSIRAIWVGRCWSDEVMKFMASQGMSG